MIKNHRKWIAVLVVLTFTWVLQVSAMPLTASGSPKEGEVMKPDQGPGFVEAVGPKAVLVKKKSILPYVLIGAGAVALAVVLILVTSKTSYDITGTWDFVFITNSYKEYFTLAFRGTKTSGDVSFSSLPQYSGGYTVDGKKVTMTLPNFPLVQFSGQFTDKDTMSGTWLSVGITTTWTATRK